ncbi:MAG: GNAT family N-acetyltransferase [Anaerolineales bacterium]|nr:GNAT family N-acetyltransferase [Anaerolineales bacterium]
MRIQNNLIDVKMETAVPGLVFRHFRGDEDIPAMVEIINRSNIVDGNDWTTTVEETRSNYRHMTNCDPYQDMVFAEVHGEMIGYSRCWWEVQLDGIHNYAHFAQLRPDWRGEGIRRAMLQFNESRLRQIAKSHPSNGTKFLTSFASDGDVNWAEALQDEGYKPVRYFVRMVRPSLHNIPNYPLPENIEVRQGSHTEWRKIWEACREAFKDNWGETEWTDEDFHAWSEQPSFDPTLFQIGWNGTEVAGGVLNYIDTKENEAFGRLRGNTEGIFVRQFWRGQGLAKALIARSLQVLKKEGMEGAALGVDTENTTGAVQLYTGLGFQADKLSATYRKPL